MMSMLKQCNHKAAFLENLLQVNRQAGVAPEILDLIESYATLRISRNKELAFYSTTRPISDQDKELQTFLQKNSHIDQCALNFLSNYYLEMKASRLRCIFSNEHLAHILGTPLNKLRFLGQDNKGNYSRFNIPKNNGKARAILAPKLQLKQVQRKINDLILQRVPLNNKAEGFRKKRSIITNASHHLGQNIVIKIDLCDFFPSIGFERVLGMFLSLGYPRQVALLLSNLSTFNRVLPTGAPTSPAISNIIARKLDKRFVNLGTQKSFEYSRYADDIAISSSDENIVRMVPFFKMIIESEGFVVNEEKLRILRNSRRQKVTGIVVNQKPNIDRREVRKIRAVLHNCKNGNIQEQSWIWAEKEKNLNHPKAYTVNAFKKSLGARIHFIKMVNQEVGKNLLSEYKNIFDHDC